MAFEFNIEEEVAVLSVKPNGWEKLLTKTSWNGREAKYDIRDWSPERDKMGKGITITQEELYNLSEETRGLFEGEHDKTFIRKSEHICIHIHDNWISLDACTHAGVV